jgi:membrane protein DedA with SNARE-associated domain
MSKKLKALALSFLGCIIWSGLVYIAIAFLKSELNPFIWSQFTRGVMLFVISCYVAFIPAIVFALKNEM